MQAGRFIGGALLAAGLMFTGCGGAPTDDVAEQDMASREDAERNCGEQSYELEYYSDATYTKLVGTRGCDCGIWARWGVTSAYMLSYSYTCSAAP
ncbi:hypothetical protein NVS55_28690 [Myxococcus stipitatus]|uniref:hypothetical protein n=1 Tax=Myxococcus stipitatus TaxID=83455 RepID=UPI0031450C42